MNEEKKPDVNFRSQIFLFFCAIIGYFFSGEDLIRHISVFAFLYACVSFAWKTYRLRLFFDLGSQVSLEYSLFISNLILSVMVLLLFLTQDLVVFVFVVGMIGTNVLFLYKMLMFHDRRLSYLSDRITKKISEKIHKDLMLVFNEDNKGRNDRPDP